MTGILVCLSILNSIVIRYWDEKNPHVLSLTEAKHLVYFTFS